MQASLTETQTHLREQMTALGDLQLRFEKLNRRYHKLRHEKVDLLATTATTEQKLESLAQKLSLSEESSKNYRAETQSVRELLKNSPTPETATLESAKAEARTLAEGKASLERKLASLSNTLDFTRQQYQLASTSAAEASTTIATLEDENASLRTKASGEAVRLRELNMVNGLAQEVEQNERLMAEIEDLKELLRKKDKGRGVTTRTGSVAPRSPRMGGSPARSRQGSRAPGSRQGSPVRSLLGGRKWRGLVGGE